jgi:hypothetical protein
VRALTLAGLVVCAGLIAGSARAQIGRAVDRTQYSIHVNVANQLDLTKLRMYLAEADRILQQDEGDSDVACCMSLQAAPPSGRPDAESLVVFGTPDDGLDVIDSSEKFSALKGKRAIVQTISWCGSSNPSLIGCAETPGDELVVALDAGPQAMAQVIAHERGHNANLVHRGANCALMAPSLSYGGGCLTASECSMYRTMIPYPGPPPSVGSPILGSCDCMGPAVGDPVDPDGTACVRDGAPGTCHHSGLCDPPPANDTCALATPVTGALVLLDDDYNANRDGSSTCSPGAADVWYRYTPTCTGQLELDLCDAEFDVQVAALRSCAAGSQNELICGTGCASPPRPGCTAGGACAVAPVQAGAPLLVRVASQTGATGPFVLRASCRAGSVVDTDGDGVPDFYDNCPRWPDASQSDVDANGIGDACECGDQTGDGRVDANDLIAINMAVFTPALATLLCDANNDGRCDVRDILATNAKIFGGSAYCSRYPPP